MTFFRVRPGVGEDNPTVLRRARSCSRMRRSPTPIGRLRHAERSAREGFDLAYAREGGWTSGSMTGPCASRTGACRQRPPEPTSRCGSTRATQPVLLQGEAGYSRKGPDALSASYYYSLPQLAVSGELAIEGRTAPVTGDAWLDHEWSSEKLDFEARGWDWTGINLDDGGALMAFRMRDAQGRARWAAGTPHRQAS